MPTGGTGMQTHKGRQHRTLVIYIKTDLGHILGHLET